MSSPIFILDGKGNVHNSLTGEMVWSGEPFVVCYAFEELARLQTENKQLHRLVETGKQAARQALTLYQENEGLRDELRKLNAHA